MVVGEILFIPTLAPLCRDSGLHKVSQTCIFLHPKGHKMNVAAVIDKHISPSAAEHLHRINVGGMSRHYATEILAHAVKTVKASVFAVVIGLDSVPFGKRHRAEIVKVAVAVLFLFFYRVSYFRFSHSGETVSVCQHIS